MAKADDKAPRDSAHVRFGKGIFINTNARLSRFDNGHSLAYQAYNERDKTKSFIALVADVKDLPRWASIPNYNALADTSFLRLVGSGSINWPLEGKQKYIFMYAGDDVGECLVKPGQFCAFNWRHPDIVDYFIQPMARMLKEMQDKNFTHGSIRASNIYCSAADKARPVVLGDGLAAHPGSTQSPVFLPPSKALAAPMGRGHGSLDDDIYAFGVSLLFFLRKGDALAGLSDEEIVRKKIEVGSYVALIGKERFQVSFLELLKGVLCDNLSQRWGVEEIFMWLDGARLTAPNLLKKHKANRPIELSGQKYLYAEFLAFDMHEHGDEIVKIVEDGSLGQWVAKSVDSKELTARFEKALERTAALGGSLSENKDFLVTQLRMALNPVLPIFYKGLCFTHDGVGGMMAQAICAGEGLGFYKEVLNLNLPDQSLVEQEIAQTEMMLVLKQYDTCRSMIRRQKIGAGIEQCFYTLCPSASCLSEKLKGHIVTGGQSLLLACEALCKKGEKNAAIIDQHLAAFFAVHSSNMFEKVSYSINSHDRGEQVLGNLRFFAMIQKSSKVSELPALASLFLESVSGAYKAFKYRDMRKNIQAGVKEAAKDGDLFGMVALLDNEEALSKDGRGFTIASAEYKRLHEEYNDYNRSLANKRTYGVSNGRDIAAVISWLIATIITVVSVISFLSGNKIF